MSISMTQGTSTVEGDTQSYAKGIQYSMVSDIGPSVSEFAMKKYLAEYRNGIKGLLNSAAADSTSYVNSMENSLKGAFSKAAQEGYTRRISGLRTLGSSMPSAGNKQYR